MKLMNTIIYYADSNPMHQFLFRQELEAAGSNFEVVFFNTTDRLIMSLMQQAIYFENSTQNYVLLIDTDLPDFPTSGLRELIMNQFVNLKTYLVFSDAVRIADHSSGWANGYLRKPVTAALFQTVSGLACNN